MSKETENNLIYNLSEALVDKFLTLEYRIATGCRCLSCYSYQFKDLDDNIVLESEDLADLLKQVANYEEED